MDQSQPLRVLHLTAASDAGGLSRYIFDLCSAMGAQGHQVAVAGEAGAWHEMFEKAPWPWIHVPLKGGPLALWKAAGILRRYLRDHPVDVLHAHYRKAVLVARRLQKTSRLPILYTLHSSHLKIGGLRRWLSDFGDHVHVASEQSRRWIIDQAKVPSDRVTLIPHGVDAGKFPVADGAARQAARQALGLAANHRVAAYVGRLEYLKNEEWMLDLAAATRHSLPHLRLLLAGDGPHQPALRRRIAHQGLQDRVMLLGQRDPLGVYHAADALLLPSQREGFSLVCAEAMCSGRPVLRTRTSGSQELIVEGITGVSVPIDKQAFVAAAEKFLALPQDKLDAMGAAAAQHIRDHFRFDRQLEQTIALYRRLIQ